MAMGKRRAEGAGNHEPLTHLRVRTTARPQVRLQERRIGSIEGADRGGRRLEGDPGAVVRIHASGTYRFAVPDQPSPIGQGGA